VLEAGENERIRIARELHDGLGQILSTAKLQLYSLEEQLDSESKANLQNTLSIIDEAVVEVRTISHNMMPAVLMRLGLVPALHEMARKINMAKKVKIDLGVDDFNNHLSKDAEIAIYRIVQEILNNALKHSNASRIDIRLKRRNNDVLLSIGDNGIGMDASKVEKSSGIGWLSINARVSMLNGSISINSMNGTGTVVNVKLVA
jgi:signal transduction histidine kinase